MQPIFEYSDTLNSPYEAFYFDAQKSGIFPITPHWHYFMEIIYMTEGSAYMEAGKKNYVLKPGDLMVFHPQVPHAIYSCGTFPIRYCVLKFDPVHLNMVNSSLPRLSHILWMIQNTPGLPVFFSGQELSGLPLEALFDRAVDVVAAKPFGYDIQAHSIYCLLIAELLKLWEQKGFHISDKPETSSDNEIFSSVAEYIDCHYGEPISIQELAGKYNMSYSHFAAKFKEYYGQSCSAFIQKIRVSKAEDLLRFTSYDLSYISQETGFCDCSHFIRVFKEHKRMTPKSFRRSLRMGDMI